MSDDPTETITTLEAKALCLRYGIKHISELEDLSKSNNYEDNKLASESSIENIASELGQKNHEVEISIISAIRKLNIRK